MKLLNVRVSLVSGADQEWSEKESILRKLKKLRDEGYKGRHLIDTLITDDWGAPPVYVEITGKTKEGKTVTEKLIYD